MGITTSNCYDQRKETESKNYRKYSNNQIDIDIRNEFKEIRE